MLSDFVTRRTHKKNRWMVQPGPIVYVTWWDVLEKAATAAAGMIIVAGIVLAAMYAMAGA